MRLSIILYLLLVFSIPGFAKQLEQQQLSELLLAEFALYRGQAEYAQEIYHEQAKAQQKSTVLAERATKVSLHTKHYSDMLSSAKHWHELEPRSEATLYLALAYSFNKQADIALPLMLGLVEQQKESRLIQWANLLSAEDAHNTELQKTLEQALKKHPQHLDLLIASALLFARAEQKSSSLAYIERALRISQQQTTEYALPIYLQFEQFDKAISLLQQQISHQPQQRKWHHALLQVAQPMGDAILQQQLEFLLTIEPSNIRYLISLASLLMQQSDELTAEQLLLQALSNQADYSPAHLYLGVLYLQQRKFDDAKAHLLSATHDDDYWPAQSYLVQVYNEQKLPHQAWHIIDNYFDQHDLERSDTRWIALKAHALAAQNQYPQAKNWYQKALSANPDSIELRYSRAILAEQHNDLVLCEADLRQILQQHPDHAITLNALGYILADRSNRYQEAFSLIKQALTLQPNDAATLDSMGWVLFKLERYNEALNYLQQAYERLPDIEIAVHYAEVLHKTGQKKQAAVILRKAKKLSPSHPLLKKTVKRLEIDL